MRIVLLAMLGLLSAVPARADDRDECRDHDRGDHDRNDHDRDEKSCKCKLQAALAELAATQAQLTSTQAQLSSTQAQLASASGALSQCQTSLSNDEAIIAARDAALASALSALAADNKQIAADAFQLDQCKASLLGETQQFNQCIAADAACESALTSCQSSLSGSVFLASCAEIQAAHPSLGDGTYTIQPAGSAPIEVHCLMSADGGGWTLVSNWPWNGTSNGTPGWNSGIQIGSGFTDLTQTFKMSDALLNQIKTSAYRVHGTATYCNVGPCQVDTTLFWSAACTYNSGGRNPHCGEAYLDAALTTREPTGATDATGCGWHWGLASGICPDTGAAQLSNEMSTSHQGDHEFVGKVDFSFIHSFDGFANNDPSIQIWVR